MKKENPFLTDNYDNFIITKKRPPNHRLEGITLHHISMNFAHNAGPVVNEGRKVPGFEAFTPE